jgi:hypothetical protein
MHAKAAGFNGSDVVAMPCSLCGWSAVIVSGGGKPTPKIMVAFDSMVSDELTPCFFAGGIHIHVVPGLMTYAMVRCDAFPWSG